MKCLAQNEIPYLGAGENREEASRILYFVANGRKIAFVSATEIERSKKYTREATETQSGVLKTLDVNKFLPVIEQAKQISDYVVAVVHWGTEGTLYSRQLPEAAGTTDCRCWGGTLLSADILIGYRELPLRMGLRWPTVSVISGFRTGPFTRRSHRLSYRRTESFSFGICRVYRKN